SVIILAGAIGWGRSGLAENVGFQSRYGHLACQLLCGIYLAGCFVPSAILGHLWQMLLLIVVVCFSFSNFKEGLVQANFYQSFAARLQTEVSRGAPIPYIVDRYKDRLLSDAEDLTEGLKILRKAHAGPFATIAEYARYEPVLTVASLQAEKFLG